MDSRHEELPILREKLSRFQSIDNDLTLELSATSKRLQRLAISLGFNDAFEAQSAIDAADPGLTYLQFTETIKARDAEVKMLRKELELVQKENTALKEDQIQRLNNFPLDADTAGYLLSFLPDFPSLISTSLSCHFLYGVFNAGRRVITCAVAVNQIGSTLPQALRLARTEAASFFQTKVSDLPTEDLVSPVGITERESAILARNAEIVTELENLFSWKNKDRTSKTSRLTEQESFRFQRALYRIMLLCFVYGMGSIFASEMGEEDDPWAHLKAYQLKQKHFLEEYPNAELYEIKKVASFLRHLGFIRILEDKTYLGSLDVYDFSGLILFAGPCFILQCYKYCNSFNYVCTYPEDDGPYAGFIMVPLDQVLSNRGQPTWLEFDVSETILDTIHGMDDICTKCNCKDPLFSGVHLVNDTCWNDQKGRLREYITLWSRNLWSNPIEIELRETLRNLDYRAFMHTLFDARPRSYRDWRKDEWICYDCLSSLWGDTLSVWWLEQKRKGMHSSFPSVKKQVIHNSSILSAGVKIEKNCWHGIRCNKQSDGDHARKFNHICDPTRWDFNS